MTTDPPEQTDGGPVRDGSTDESAGTDRSELADGDDESASGTQPDGPQTPAAGDAAPDLSVAVTLTEVGRLVSPTAGAVDAEGVIHLTDRAGTVHRLTEDGVSDPVLDITDEVSTGSERGLLGIAFAPDGEEMYLSYTDRDGDSVVAAYGVANGRVDPEHRRTVFTQDQPYGNHNGGGLAFGPDGHLYISLGDGGGAGDPLGAGQDLGTPLGSLLRIAPDEGEPYAIPSGNPFTEDPEARDEIFAYGLRNPWRFSFDSQTGELWIADVGQNSREEINRVPADEAAGANFGWSLMEGNRPFAGSEPEDHVPPVHSYETTSSRCAVTGGFVYRGTAIPRLRGAYLFSDYCEGVIRAIVVDAEGEVVDRAELGVDGGSVVSFVQDAEGELYVLDLGGGVLRLDPG